MLLTGVRRARVNGNRLLGWAESRISHAPRSVIDTSLTAFAFGSHRHISTKLFIRIVPHSTTPESLHEFLRSYGPIREVKIVPPTRDDRPPFAFVEFDNLKSALAAMEEMEFRRLEGRLIFPTFHVDHGRSGNLQGANRSGKEHRNQGRGLSSRTRLRGDGVNISVTGRHGRDKSLSEQQERQAEGGPNVQISGHDGEEQGVSGKVESSAAAEEDLGLRTDSLDGTAAGSHDSVGQSISESGFKREDVSYVETTTRA
ncbi:cold inducible rna binding protein [Nannochloropsis gaditana]|uniref:Cold inducible rna binding protein n=1 Tax=Nannochloropsis gaditana TaxID=72520 RepID=W7TK65_9STRA|nr:cold inducible rna binding protein [Nannochloropsis gaditana]